MREGSEHAQLPSPRKEPAYAGAEHAQAALGGKDGGAQRPVLQSRVESHNKRYRLDYKRTRAQVVTAQGEDARTRSEQKI